MEIQEMLPGRALVRLRPREMVSESGLLYVRDFKKRYDASVDYEIGTVEMLGEGDWEPVGEGDDVIVQAALGGKAGTDISFQFGERKGTVIVVTENEIVARVE